MNPTSPHPNSIRRSFSRTLRLLVVLGVPGWLFAAPETLALRGTVTNTTHEITAPAQLELEFTGDTVTGFLSVDKPLHAGRWPVTGSRRGAWCELVCVQVEKTQIVFRGVIGEGRYRGTYSFRGDDVVTQYGQFDLAAPAKQ